MRKANIKVLADHGMHRVDYVTLHVDIISAENGTVFDVGSHLEQYVRLDESNAGPSAGSVPPFWATTWSNWTLLTGAENNADDAKDALFKQIDEFIEDYVEENSARSQSSMIRQKKL